MGGLVKVASGVVALAAVLSGCGEFGSTSEAGSGADVSLQGPLLVISDPPSTAAAVEIAGPLTFESGCARVADHTVVWPSGTAWDEAATVLTFTSGAEATIGDQISAEAVLLPADELIEEWGGDAEVDDNVATQVRACAGPGGEIAVFAAG